MNTKVLTLTFAITLGFASAATAVTVDPSLIGDDVRGQLLAPGFTLVDTTATVVDPGEEFVFVNVDGTYSLDVKASSFDISLDLGSFLSVGSTSTWVLSDLDFDIPAIVSGVSLVSGDAGWINGISFTDDSVTVDLFDVTSPPAAQSWTFDIETEITAVPVPASLPLLLAALSVVGVTAARRKRG